MAFIEEKQKYVQMVYSFIFKRSDNIWNHAYEFEHDLAEFFKQKGLAAEPVIFAEGSFGFRTLVLRDISQEMVLKNDKDFLKFQELQSQRQPEKSYTTTKKLVDTMKNDWSKRDIKRQRKSSSIVNTLTAQLGRRTR